MSQSVGTVSPPTGPWVWLFPLAYCLHIAEEYWLHFPVWVANVSGRHISNPQFLVLNTIFWLLVVAAVVLIRARPSQVWLVVTLAAILGINAGLHLLGCAVTATYSPGAITGLILYIPLVAYALQNVIPRVSRGLAVRAAALGAAIHAVVILLAANPSLIPSP
jgi:hypothetical protein